MTSIRFIGGPLNGCVRTLDIPYDKLPSSISMRVKTPVIHPDMASSSGMKSETSVQRALYKIYDDWPVRYIYKRPGDQL